MDIEMLISNHSDAFSEFLSFAIPIQIGTFWALVLNDSLKESVHKSHFLMNQITLDTLDFCEDSFAKKKKK